MRIGFAALANVICRNIIRGSNKYRHAKRYRRKDGHHREFLHTLSPITQIQKSASSHAGPVEPFSAAAPSAFVKLAEVTLAIIGVFAVTVSMLRGGPEKPPRPPRKESITGGERDTDPFLRQLIPYELEPLVVGQSDRP